MNFFIISKLLGLLLLTLGVSMIPSLAWSLCYQDGAVLAFIESIVLTCAIGGGLFGIGCIRQQELYRREATAVVGLGWFLCAAAGALPFYFQDVFPSFIDCYFESMSGFTTTGASVLTDFEGLAKGLHFWRCFTHWLGGMGIIVLFVALLPFLGAGGRALMRSEVPGPVTESLTPHVKDTALLLWKIYCYFTIAQTILLMLCGMDLFDSLCHTFATLATGGFSTNPASITGYDNLAIELTILVFMFAAGTNFSLYYGVLRGNRKALWQDPEWRIYVSIVVLATAFITFLLVRSGVYAGVFSALRYASFQVLCLMTTTGFASANFDLWPSAAKIVLLILMFVGGCAGSTGGGIKVVRWLILAKIGWNQIEQVFSPRTVRKVRLGKGVMDDKMKSTILGFFFLWVLIFLVGTLAIATIEHQEHSQDHLVTIVTSVVATLNNIGPGLAQVGAVENYAFFHPVSKLLLSLFMVLGRLELFTILVLFVPRFWRQH